MPKQQPTLEQAKSLAIDMLERCKESRAKTKEDRNGVFKVYNLHTVKKNILLEQAQVPKEFYAASGTGIDAFKPSIFQGIMSATGILGYYNPFTAEAQYNPNLPSSMLPFTLAHESAHQLGFAREQEANFIGYLLGRNSKNADLRYSSEYFALKGLLRVIYPDDSVFVKKVISGYSDGMARDRNFEKAFFKKNEGLLSDFFGMTNDLFLKGNRQEGSITYTYFTDLLLKYEVQKKESRFTTRFQKHK